MFVSRLAFLSKLFMCGSLAATTLIGGAPTRAQVTKGCIGIGYVGTDLSNPFTAEYVTTRSMASTGGPPKVSVMKEDVARDSDGRIRIEKHGVAQPPDDRKTVTLETADGQPFTVTREEYGTLIDIFDCAAGRTIQIRPGMRMATVKEASDATPAKRVKHAYSTPYIFGPGVKIPPNMIVELLGNREIQGVAAIGMKTTTLGTEGDGQWNGKPVREYEIWVSDELAVQMVRIDKDLRTGNEGKRELLAIKREGPDPALFEIPKDYEVNPSKLPIAKNMNVIRRSQE
jgi:hypothetical protein